MLENFQNLVPQEIFRHGEQYYQEGRIKSYRLIPLKNDQFKITATVSGSENYLVEIRLNLQEHFFKYHGKCSCPYVWGEVCKHQVAAMLYFFANNFPKLTKPQNFLQFKQFMELIEKPQYLPIALKYQLKGLLTTKMNNFSLTLFSSELSEQDFLGLNRYIRDSEWNFPLSRYHVTKPLDEISLQAIEYLHNARTRMGRSPANILLAKNKANFAFIFNLTSQAEVICQETQKRIIPGKALRPKLEITGDEDQIFFQLSAADFDIFFNEDENSPVWWTMIEDVLHPIYMGELALLPKKIEIPEEMKGKLFCEILPQLAKRYHAELGAELQKYQLMKIYPEITIYLDYQNGEITCQTMVEVGQRVIKNLETLDYSLAEGNYQRSHENPYIWFGVDQDSLKEYILFLEENEFIIVNGHFVIKEKTDIQNFITGGYLQLPEDWRIKTTAAFERLEVISVELLPTIEISTTGGIDWFDFQIVYDLGGQSFTHQKIRQMLRQNSQGNDFIQIDHQYFLIANEEQRQVIEKTLQLAKTSEEAYQSKFYNLLYYRHLWKNQGVLIKGDHRYHQLEADLIPKDGADQKIIQQWELPETVKDVLRNYQKTGYFWMRFLDKYYFGGILADDMGLGKTIQVLTLLTGLKLKKPSLVVCPTSLLYNWATEIEKFFPELRYLIYYGTPKERQELAGTIEEYPIILTTYAIVSRDIEFLRDKLFSYCILDEAQLIKNFRTKRSESVKNIPAEHRLVLTGTPIENSLEELWSIFDFLMTGYLGTYSSFKKKYVIPIKEKNDRQLLNELKERVSPFILRRNKKEVLGELPPKTEQIKKVQLTRLQKDVYQTILQQVKADVMHSVHLKGFNKSRITVLAALTKLRQVCNHPQLVCKDLEEKVTSGKLEVLEEIVREAVAGGHKFLVFSQFVKMLKLIEEEFQKNGICYEYLDGSTKDRMQRVNRFNEDPEVNAFLISLKAGGTGLNLTAADIVIHVDPWWNPMVETQATDRVHRIGQKNNVLVYKLITAGTVEEKMLRLQAKKQNIFDTVIEQNGDIIKDITWQDVQELFD